MTRSNSSSATIRSPYRLSIILTVMAALAFLIMGMNAHAATAELSDEDKKCLECHAKPKEEKILGDGKKLSLYVRPKTFAESAHIKDGCEGCHSDIDSDTHGKEVKPIASKRALSVEMMETCRDCHKKSFKEYENSVHSTLVNEGSDESPVCSTCHDPHATRLSKKGPEGYTESVTCNKCHEKVTEAYATSVHGLPGDETLLCKDCHRSHSIKAVGLGEHLTKECLSCHKDTVATHKVWLPNTGRHLEAVSCAACHSPDAKRRVNLRFYEARTRQVETDKVGVPQFTRLAHAANGANGSGLDSRALWSLLQEFNRDGSGGKTVLRGRLEVRSGAENHLLADKSQAIKECDTCHLAGAESFQSVTVSMTGPDGRLLRHDAQKGLLSSAGSIESVSGFYAIGSTRIKALDILLLLTVAAGIGIPIGHFSLRWYFRRQREQQAAAAALSSPGSPYPNGRRSSDNPPN
jgi:hypothetical protein